ncbi:MAG: phosphate ABC transporter substrate-binding protein [Actinomycetota bacterium]|nr:phosphate ABC transporter substrate-binding protein [Actinomycetota bacterium]
MVGKSVRRTVVIILALSVFSLALAGCGGEKGKNGDTGSSGSSSSSEKLTYTGSSTIGQNIMPEAFKTFSKTTGVKIGAIDNPGSGKGMEALIAGKAKLAGASRPLTPEEESKGAYSQIIGYDAICVFVNEENPVKGLTAAQVKDIFTGKVKNWKEVGGNDAPIAVVTEILGGKRATQLEFQKLVMDNQDYTSNRKEVDMPIDEPKAVVADKNAITAASMSFSTPGARAVSVNNVKPSISNIRSGAYILSRPLVLSTRGQPEGINKQFIDFMVSSEGQAIVGKKFATAE